jgi:hypothetical protein
MPLPCSKTCRNWCRLGFDGWLESQKGSDKSGVVSWALGRKSKFCMEQVCQWFAYKDNLYLSENREEEEEEEEEEADTSTDEMGKTKLNNHIIIMIILLQLKSQVNARQFG